MIPSPNSISRERELIVSPVNLREGKFMLLDICWRCKSLSQYLS